MCRYAGLATIDRRVMTMNGFKRGDQVVVVGEGFNRAVGVVVKTWSGSDVLSVVWPKGKGNGGFLSSDMLRPPTTNELKAWPVAPLPKLGW